jgi:hypothetical protein
MAQKRIPEHLQAWIDARKRHKLSHAHVQMGRELGMNPRKLGKLDNHNRSPGSSRCPHLSRSCASSASARSGLTWCCRSRNGRGSAGEEGHPQGSEATAPGEDIPVKKEIEMLQRATSSIISLIGTSYGRRSGSSVTSTSSICSTTRSTSCRNPGW